MREIKFKAKRKDNQEWVYGYYVKLYNTQNKEISNRIYTGYSEYCCDELFEEFYEVIPETICECTGLKDKNCVEIYENDIVEVVSDNWDIIEPKERKFVVEYRQDSFGIGYDLADLFDFEVIRNIHDKEVENEE